MIRLSSSLVAKLVEPAYDLYEGSARLRTMRKLDRLQWDPPATIEQRRSESLRALVRHAAKNSPFYAERFAEAGIDPRRVNSIADLRDLPLLTKSDIRRRTDHILARTTDLGPLIPAKTGGSTGVALKVWCDTRGVQQRNGAALWVDRWSGWELGQVRAHVWGNPPVPKNWKQKLRRAVKDRLFFLDTMRLDDAAVEAFSRDWRRLRPGMLFGHAHSIFLVAEALDGRPPLPPPGGIVSTSMMLLQQEREVIERVFGTSVTNRYGCEEVSLIACECERHHGMHINAEHVIVEILRDDGTPADFGEDGRIVVTELINRGMPMIRYEVGDRGVVSDRRCDCGRGLPMLETLTGRTADFLVCADGARTAGISLIENTLTAMPGIRQMQMVQDAPLELLVRLVPGQDYGEDTEAELRERLGKALGDGFAFSVEIVEEIPRETSGKYRFSICNV